MQYCVVPGGAPVDGNIHDPPHFYFPDEDILYLLPSSPCIDSGHAESSEVCFQRDGHEICLDELYSIIGDTPDSNTVDIGYHYSEPCPATPTPIPTCTFTPTMTPTNCPETGVTIRMPSQTFRAGDTCWCNVDVCNAGATPMTNHPLFVILDVYGSLYFAPSFGEFDSFLDDYPEFPIGEIVVEVLPLFSWPENVGSASGIQWYAALTNPEITQIVGEWDTFVFGWI